MRKTLLLCFIHGFKGGDDTFGKFPEHLRALCQNGLPDLEVREIVYPKFETRGDLAECVGRFREWLQEQVINVEVAKETPSPTVDPSVHTILIGHSMGGIVAADTILAITSDKVVEASASQSSAINSLMFPYIQGVLAFDTPYLGISPGVVAHGAEGHYKIASSAFTQLSSITGAIWGAKTADEGDTKKKQPIAALPAPPTAEASTSTRQKWGKMAMYVGAAGAVAAGGAAAYLKREQITEGWSWVGSHLEFVGCLMKGEELKKRVAGVVKLNEELGVGFADMYTRLGKAAMNKDGSFVGAVIGNMRTFCNLPKSETRRFFLEAINDEAKDETLAHMSMFFPKDNPGYHAMLEQAKELVVEWTAERSYIGEDDKDYKMTELQMEEDPEKPEAGEGPSEEISQPSNPWSEELPNQVPV